MRKIDVYENNKRDSDVNRYPISTTIEISPDVEYIAELKKEYSKLKNEYSKLIEQGNKKRNIVLRVLGRLRDKGIQDSQKAVEQKQKKLQDLEKMLLKAEDPLIFGIHAYPENHKATSAGRKGILCTG